MAVLVKDGEVVEVVDGPPIVGIALKDWEQDLNLMENREVDHLLQTVSHD